MKTVFAFLFLLVVPISFAVDTLTIETCGREGITGISKEVCGILTPEDYENATLDVQKRSILNMFTKGSETVYEQHKFVEVWNTQLDLTDAPINITPQNKSCSYQAPNKPNKDCIQNPWMKILTVQPSFMENNDLYINKSGKVITGYNYTLQIPDDYREYYPGETVCGDKHQDMLRYCRTEHRFISDTTYFDVSLEHELMPDAKIRNYKIENKTNFNAKLEIINNIERKYWTWYQGNCCDWDSCCHESIFGCVGCCRDYFYTCSYSGTEPVIEKLSQPLTDTFQIKLYKEPVWTNTLTIKDKTENPILEFYTNSTECSLNLGNAEIKKKSEYILDWSFAPYNILHLVKQANSNLVFISDVRIESSFNNTVRFKYPSLKIDSCKVEYFYPFEKKEENCRITQDNAPIINIKTQKYNYGEDETIKVYVNISKDDKPVEDKVKISYANKTYDVQLENGIAQLQLESVLDENEITAEYKGIDTTSKIFVYQKDRLYSIMVIACLIILAFLSVKVYTKKVLERY